MASALEQPKVIRDYLAMKWSEGHVLGLLDPARCIKSIPGSLELSPKAKQACGISLWTRSHQRAGVSMMGSAYLCSLSMSRYEMWHQQWQLGHVSRVVALGKTFMRRVFELLAGV